MKKGENFWDKIDKSGGPNACWPWIGAKPLQRVTTNINGKIKSVSRWAYILTYGDLPSSIYVCHHCDNPPCCNLAHLFAGTPKANTEDMVRKGRDRKAVGEGAGLSKFTDEQILQIREEYAAGGRIREIARRRASSHGTIDAIVKFQTWKHLGGPSRPSFIHRGEKASHVKFTESIVREIRFRFEAGERNKAKLGREFGATDVNIGHIVARRTWTHI